MSTNQSIQRFKELDQGFVQPQRCYAPMPFWFLNDNLDAQEIRRQIHDYYDRGIGGFVLHPRVGLPRSLGWMSDKLLGYMRVAIEEAKHLRLTVILYDEGMYPSGSSCGQVVASNAGFACRGIDHVLLKAGEPFALPEGCNLIAQTQTRHGQLLIAYDRKIKAEIRGLHYLNHDQSRIEASADGARPNPAEDHPPAGDLLNPEAMAKFIELVYDKYYQAFGQYFGTTIQAIFTDEPNVLGRSPERGKIMPGTTDIMVHINRILGYDFTPYLPALWYDDEPDALHYRCDWKRAIGIRLEETYYAPIRRWCDEHGVQLTGHPSEPDDISTERHFHIPGQDMVWQHVLPGNDSALVGASSTMAKCASSAMVHLGLTRNANEIFGAYGHDLTYETVQWLSNWAMVRGQNLLIPHAFYYSTRGPRLDERPPDIGFSSSWWDRFKDWAEHVSRICYLNTQGMQQCQIAVLCGTCQLPDLLVKPLYENQLDFNYMTTSDLLERASIDDAGIHIEKMHYQVLLSDGSVPITQALSPKIQQLVNHGRFIQSKPLEDTLQYLKGMTNPAIELSTPQSDLRVRHVTCDQAHWLMLFNEGIQAIDFECKILLPCKQITSIDVYHQTARQCQQKISLSIASGQLHIIHALSCF